MKQQYFVKSGSMNQSINTTLGRTIKLINANYSIYFLKY